MVIEDERPVDTTRVSRPPLTNRHAFNVPDVDNGN